MATSSKHTEAVKLIVKAPNQLIEDQNVECDLSWTVLHLKDHLSNVYPTQPVISDQKLIYSGQLLADDAVLKDVLRIYEGQKAHSLHLVCAPPRGASDSWRKAAPARISRPATPIPPPAQAPQTPTPVPASTPASSTEAPSSSTPASSNPQEGWTWLHATQQRFMAASAQHPAMMAYAPAGWGTQMYDPASLAQMQQAYAQYMSQYIGRLQQAGVPSEVLGSLQAQQWSAANVPRAAQQQANPLPVNPNAQNNQPAQAPMMAADDDDMRLGRHRDWLDWFYVLSRLLVLFSIVYFYSSLKRFVLVSVLGLMLYLYHLGYFRIQQPNQPAPPAPQQQQQEAEVAGDNNNQPAAPAQQAQVEEEHEAPAGLADAEGLRQRHPEPQETPEPQVEPPAPHVEPPSMVNITWTFLSSFFTSLIPDRPNVV